MPPPNTTRSIGSPGGDEAIELAREQEEPIHDGEIPSGNSMALRALARMFEIPRRRARSSPTFRALPPTHQALITYIEGATHVLAVSPDGEEEESALALAALALPSRGRDPRHGRERGGRVK